MINILKNKLKLFPATHDSETLTSMNPLVLNVLI